MQVYEIFEIVMLVCFGFSWPVAAVKNIRSHSTKSTSLPFLCLILVGYAAGVAAKLISGNVGYVLIAYAVNIVMVLANAVIYFINRRLERKTQTA